MRGHRQSAVPGLLSAAADENINRYKDEVDENDFARLVNTAHVDSHRGSDTNYRPKGVPHPLAAVRRGIAYEWSYRLLERIVPFGIKLTGLAFGLDLLHADLLWIALANVTSDKFTRILEDHQGDEADEGQIKFIPASFGSRSTQDVLAQSNWYQAGKASVIRAIELITDYKPNARPADVFDILAEAR